MGSVGLSSVETIFDIPPMEAAVETQGTRHTNTFGRLVVVLWLPCDYCLELSCFRCLALSFLAISCLMIVFVIVLPGGLFCLLCSCLATVFPLLAFVLFGAGQG